MVVGEEMMVELEGDWITVGFGSRLSDTAANPVQSPRVELQELPA